MSILKTVSELGIIGPGRDGEIVVDIQRGLIASGHSLVLDGLFGAVTETAVKRLQAAHKLAVVGYVGTKTAKVLDEALGKGGAIPVPEASVLSTLPWLAQMRAITGTAEIPGRANSPIIMSWIGDIAQAYPDMAKYAGTYTGDEIPWCGFGLAACMARVGIRPPEGFMFALNWVKWGKRLADPVPGCVMVFKRSGGGHVSLLERMDGAFAYIRGCNQSDMINVAHKSMKEFVAAVWPAMWRVPEVAIAGNISSAVKSASEA